MCYCTFYVNVCVNVCFLLFQISIGLCGSEFLSVYCSCCLAGRAYPLGDIPDNLVAKVKEEVCIAE